VSDRRRRRRSRRGAAAGGQAPAKRRRRLGGRSARVRSAVLQSAFQLLMEKGIDAVTIAEVAARAKVHETSIYRRWGTKHALARDACVHYGEVALAIPDTGSLRSDLVALLERLIAILRSPQGRTVLALSLSQHPHVVAARQGLWQRRFDSIRTVFDKAVSRGEFPRHADSMAVLETLIAPLYFRVLITGGPLENWPTNEMIDRMLTAYAVRPQAGSTHNKGRRKFKSARRPNND
jgi:AcrR family transcriptional regulator